MDILNGEVGIIDKKAYYSRDLDIEVNRITIADTIYLDKKMIAEKTSEGLDPKTLKTFLIGGCHSVKSIEAMAEFMEEINPNMEKRLIVTDMNDEAIELIKDVNALPKNIKLDVFQGDLLELGLKSASIDYARMDYTQNFISGKDQKRILTELKRVITNNGIIGSVVEIIPKAKSFFDKLERHFFNPDLDSRTESLAAGGIMGYNNFVPSYEYLEKVAKKAKLKIGFVNGDLHYNTQTVLAYFEKKHN